MTRQITETGSAASIALVAVLAAVALSACGALSTPAPTATPRPAPAATATPTETPLPTLTPTWVPIPTATPRPTPRGPTSTKQDGPPGISNVTVAGGPFYLYSRERACPQNPLVVRAKITDPNGIAEAVVFYRFVQSVAEKKDPIQVAMDYVGDDIYAQIFQPFPTTGTFDYVVAASDRLGAVARSSFTMPVTIGPCISMPTLVPVPTFR